MVAEPHKELRFTRSGQAVGFFVAGAIDFTKYGTTNITTLNAVAVDILAATVMASITGAVVAWVLGAGATK